LVLVVLAAEAYYSRLPVAAVALATAFLPANASGNLMLTNARTRFGWRASLDLVSAVALGAVLATLHSALPIWLVVFGAAAAAFCLVSTVVELLLWRRRRKAAA
jgi:hypothetical protein